MGERTLCINSGPSGGITISQPFVVQFELGTGLTNDTPSDRSVLKVSDDKCNDRAGNDNDKYLRHDGEASDKDDDS